MLSQTIPGTNIRCREDDDAFSVIRPMIEITGGLTLSQLNKITGISATTIQNWAHRGYIPRAENKKYYERHVARLLIVAALKECMNVEDINELMEIVNGDTNDESDDIIPDSKLYDYFCRVLKQLDELSISGSNIDKAVRIVLENEVENVEILERAMKVMVYAYISGKCLTNINENFNELKKIKEV